MSGRVAILGGGVGGLSAAHELLVRGFQVDVFEARPVVGGKARSTDEACPGGVRGVDGTARPLPAEHGFRFFPGFYRHLFDTMKRIPFGRDGKTVFDNLAATTAMQIARVGDDEILVGARFPSSVRQFRAAMKRVEIPSGDLARFVARLAVLLTSCGERRLTEYERQSWRQFIEVDKAEQPELYDKYFSGGLTRCLVAARADKMSARTGGSVLLQLLFDLTRPGRQADCVLNGPTSDVWINPWREYLADATHWRSRGQEPVRFHTGARIEELHFDAQRKRIAGFTVFRQNRLPGQQHLCYTGFDHYVAALPVEVMARLVTDAIKQADPSLSRLDQMETGWMNGVVFYLRKTGTQITADGPKAKDLKRQLKAEKALSNPGGEHVLGHTLYIDSTWALTSISQVPFWRPARYDPRKLCTGQVERILSICVSDWETPSNGTHRPHPGRPARELTCEQVKTEIWEQLKDHLNDGYMQQLCDQDRLHCYLDEAIRDDGSGTLVNDEPLLINTVSSWGLRPEAVTAIENLFLAADYVRTNTDLATMESANEAARRAVNGILAASGSPARRCTIWPLKEPRILAPLRWYDRWRFHRGQPHSQFVERFAYWIALPLWDLFHVIWLPWQIAHWAWQPVKRLWRWLRN